MNLRSVKSERERDDLGLGVGVVDINPSHVTLVGANNKIKCSKYLMGFISSLMGYGDE